MDTSIEKGAQLPLVEKPYLHIPESCQSVAAYLYNEFISLKDLWKNEALDFTPWLAQNQIIPIILNILDGNDYHLWRREYPVGDYRIDMLYQSQHDFSSFIVENQYGVSDSKHFGQILMYSYLTKIPNILWICDDVSLEHRRIVKEMNDVNCVPCSIQLFSKFNKFKELIGYRLIASVYTKKEDLQVIFDVSSDLKDIQFVKII